MRSTERLATRTRTSDESFAHLPSGAARRCLDAIISAPRSVDELMVDLNMSHSTCSAAVNRLKRLGWVYDMGYTTVTRSGRTAIVWMARQTPVPIIDSRPTRAELDLRVRKALLALAAKADSSCIERILRGEPHE